MIVCNPILTVDLVYESLHICVSIHFYMYMYICTRKWQHTALQ